MCHLHGLVISWKRISCLMKQFRRDFLKISLAMSRDVRGLYCRVQLLVNEEVFPSLKM